MSRRSPNDRNVLAAAAAQAVMDARWYCEDLLSRTSRHAAPGLLREQASELASSGLARDQLLAVVLLNAAGEVEQLGATSRPDLLSVLTELQGEPSERDQIQAEVFHAGPRRSADSQAVAARIEDRLRIESRSASELSDRLCDEARLHELLWDHPRLACDARTRLLILFVVPKLLERAAEIGASKPRPAVPVRAEQPTWPSDTPWFRRPVLGMLPQGWLLAAGAVLAAAATGLLSEG